MLPSEARQLPGMSQLPGIVLNLFHMQSNGIITACVSPDVSSGNISKTVRKRLFLVRQLFGHVLTLWDI